MCRVCVCTRACMCSPAWPSGSNFPHCSLSPAPCMDTQPPLLTPRRRLELKPLDNRIWLHPEHAVEPTELTTEDVLADAAAHPGVLGMLSWRQTGICSYPTLVLSRPLVSDDGDEE